MAYFFTLLYSLYKDFILKYTDILYLYIDIDTYVDIDIDTAVYIFLSVHLEPF